MVQDRAWSPIGSPIIEDKSGQRKPRLNLLCGLDSNFEPVAPYLIKENCRADNFETWFWLYFLPQLRSDAVISMDNARFHRKEVLFDLIKHYNVLHKTQLSILFLPPYSPDLNPIEKFFGVLKGKVKRLCMTGKSVEESLKACLLI